MTEDAEITFDQEAVLLNDLQDIFAGPWACNFCGDVITNEIGGKPQVYLHGNERDTGIDRVIVCLFCGTCAQHQVAGAP